MSNSSQYITNRKRADTMRAGYANIWHYTDRSAANGGPALSPHDDIGDGSKDCTGCLAATSASGLPTYVPPGTYLINSNITLTKNITLAPGAKLKPASGVVVSLLGGYTTEDDNHVFDVSLGGSVIVGGSGYVTPMHFGADQTGTVDSLTTIQAMLGCGASNFNFGKGAFKVGGGLTMTSKSNFAVYGSATLTQTVTLQKTITLTSCTDCSITGLKFVGKGNENAWAARTTAYNGVAAIALVTCSRVTISKNKLSNHAGGGIFLDQTCPNITITDNDIVGMGSDYIIAENNASDAGIISGGSGGYAKENLIIARNRVSEHAFGILCQGAGACEISGNFIFDIRGQHGIYYTNPGTLSVVGNIVHGCAEGGIKVQTQSLVDNDAAILIANNNTYDTSRGVGLGYAGIAVAQVLSGLFTNVSVVNNNVSKSNSEAEIGTFTMVSSNTITIAKHQMQSPNRIAFTSTDTLPAGLSAGVLYYCVNATLNTFQVSTTNGGAAVTITDSGTGTHTALAYYTSPASNGYGIIMQGCKNMLLANNRVSNCGYVGLFTRDCSGSILGNNVSVTQAAGMALDCASTIGTLYVDDNNFTDVGLNKYSAVSSQIWRAGLWMSAVVAGKVYLGKTTLRGQNETPSANMQYAIYVASTLELRLTGAIVNELLTGIPIYYQSTLPLLTYGTTCTDQFLVDCSAGGTAQTVNLSLIPRNSILQNVNIYVSQAFNGNATKTIEVGVSGNTDKYIDPVDASTAGAGQSTMSGGTNNDQKHPERMTSNTQLICTWTNSASASAGKALISITYTVLAGK